MPFTELMQKVGIEETGTSGFHIKRLKELLERTDEGRYKLSELGLVTYRILRYAEKGSGEEPRRTEEKTLKVFKGSGKILVTKDLIEKYGKIAFEWMSEVLFAEDMDEELFRNKVLYFKGIGTIVVPKPLVRLAYSRMEDYMGGVVGYEGKLPEEWLAGRRVKTIENYGGRLIVSKKRLERAREEGYRLRIENYGVLIIGEDVPPELFDEVVVSIESYGPVYALRHLHELIHDKLEVKYSKVYDLSALSEETISTE